MTQPTGSGASSRLAQKAALVSSEQYSVFDWFSQVAATSIGLKARGTLVSNRRICSLVSETKGFSKPVHLVTEGNSSIGVTFCGKLGYCSEKVINTKGSDKRTASGGLVQTAAIILGDKGKVESQVKTNCRRGEARTTR